MTSVVRSPRVWSARPWWIGQLVLAGVLFVITIAAEFALDRIYDADEVGPSAQVLVQIVYRGLILSLVVNGLVLALRRPNLVRQVDRVLLLTEAGLLAVANLLALVSVPLRDDDKFGVFLLGSVPVWGFLSVAALVVLITTIFGNVTVTARGRQTRPASSTAR